MGRAVGDDDHVVFATDTEFAGDVDAGLVGEGHSGFEDGFTAADEIRMLVTIEANAVAEAVSEELIVGAEAGGGDYAAGGIVDRAGELSRTSCGESGILRLADGLKGALNFI